MKLPRGLERQRKQTAPQARWMTDSELTAHAFRHGVYDRADGNGKTASILLGKTGDTWLGSDDDRHVVTVAGSRSGKSSTSLKPNLMLWPSSVMCIDPKGELAEASAMKRAAMGQDVFILDPFGEVKGDAARFRVNFNPLDELANASEADRVDDSALLAEALIIEGSGGDQHWTLSAKNALRGLTLYALLRQPDAASLPLVRDLVNLPLEADDDKKGQSLLGLFKLMQGTGEALDGAVSRSGSSMIGKPRGERGSIISTAIEQTSFLDSMPLRNHLKSSGKLQSLRQLKQRPTTIFLVLPASRIPTHSRWLRVILTLALAALEREPMKLPAPVLFILEEFPALGHMRQIEAAAGLMAGYGVKLWTIIQDLSQLKALYRDSWETFLGNAGAVQAFANTDPTTLEYISRSLGNLQISEAQENQLTQSQAMAGAQGRSDTSRTVPLLAPFEVAQYASRESNQQYALLAGKPPAYIERLSHQEVKNLGT